MYIRVRTSEPGSSMRTEIIDFDGESVKWRTQKPETIEDRTQITMRCPIAKNPRWICQSVIRPEPIRKNLTAVKQERIARERKSDLKYVAMRLTSVGEISTHDR
jgi:hypothetical protein